MTAAAATRQVSETRPSDGVVSEVRLSPDGAAWSVTLHSKQQEIYSHPARIKVLAAGRRFGKSTLGAFWLLSGALDDHRRFGGGRSWVVTPTYSLGEPIYEACLRIAPVLSTTGRPALVMDDDTATTPYRVIRVGKSVIEFRSAERPRSLVGFGLRRLLLDESAQIPEPVYSYYLRPMLFDYAGPVLMISTPAGKNWFYRRFLEGLSYGTTQHDVKSWRGYSWENPWLSLSEIMKAKGDMLERAWAQEVEGEFLRESTSVFDGVHECAAGPSSDAPMVVGVDLARKVDATVLFGLDARGRWTNLFRWRKAAWEVQIDRIAWWSRLCEQHFHRAPLFVVDGTGVGDPVVERLSQKGVSVQPFVFTQQSKTFLVESWALALQQRMATVPRLEDAKDPVSGEPHGRVFLQEHEDFDVTLSDLGRPRYSAPEGAHDDCVMAAALAWHGLHHGVGVGAAPGALL